jgi:hypothetical protein
LPDKNLKQKNLTIQTKCLYHIRAEKSNTAVLAIKKPIHIQVTQSAVTIKIKYTAANGFPASWPVYMKNI